MEWNWNLRCYWSTESYNNELNFVFIKPQTMFCLSNHSTTLFQTPKLDVAGLQIHAMSPGFIYIEDAIVDFG